MGKAEKITPLLLPFSGNDSIGRAANGGRSMMLPDLDIGENIPRVMPFPGSEVKHKVIGSLLSWTGMLDLNEMPFPLLAH